MNIEDMKNEGLRLLAKEWSEGKDVKGDVAKASGLIGLRDVLFIVSVMNGESHEGPDRALHVFPVACSGMLYEIFFIADGTPPKGYASLHTTFTSGARDEAVMKVGWRDVQFKQTLGPFVLDDELLEIEAGVYLFDPDYVRGSSNGLKVVKMY